MASKPQPPAIAVKVAQWQAIDGSLWQTYAAAAEQSMRVQLYEIVRDFYSHNMLEEDIVTALLEHRQKLMRVFSPGKEP